MIEPSKRTEATARRLAQDQLIVGLLTAGHSYGEAGAAAGLSARTVARRMSDPVFAGMVVARREARVADITDRLTGLGPGALDVVQACMRDEGAKPADRLRAASVALSLILRFRQLDGLERQVAAIQDQLAASIEAEDR